MGGPAAKGGAPVGAATPGGRWAGRGGDHPARGPAAHATRARRGDGGQGHVGDDPAGRPPRGVGGGGRRAVVLGGRGGRGPRHGRGRGRARARWRGGRGLGGDGQGLGRRRAQGAAGGGGPGQAGRRQEEEGEDGREATCFLCVCVCVCVFGEGWRALNAIRRQLAGRPQAPVWCLGGAPNLRLQRLLSLMGVPPLWLVQRERNRRGVGWR